MFFRRKIARTYLGFSFEMHLPTAFNHFEFRSFISPRLTCSTQTCYSIHTSKCQACYWKRECQELSHVLSLFHVFNLRPQAWQTAWRGIGIPICRSMSFSTKFYDFFALVFLDSGRSPGNWTSVDSSLAPKEAGDAGHCWQLNVLWNVDSISTIFNDLVVPCCSIAQLFTGADSHLDVCIDHIDHSHDLRAQNSTRGLSYRGASDILA